MLTLLKRIWPKSIKLQLIAGFILTLFLVMSLFVFDSVNRQKHVMLQQTTSHAKSMVQSLAVNASSYIMSNDLGALERLLKSQQNYPDLEYAMILSDDEVVLAHTSMMYIGKSPTDSISRLLKNKEATVQVLLADENSLDIAAPVLGQHNEIIGWVRIGFNQQSIYNDIQIFVRKAVVYLVIALFLGIIIVVFIAANLNKELYKLIEAAKRIRSGENGIRIKPSRLNEISELGTALNSMLDSLNVEQKLRSTVLDNLPVGVWIINEKGEIIYGNKASLEIWGGAKYVGINELEVYNGWFAENGKKIQPDEWGAATAIQKGETNLNREIIIESFDGVRKTILHSSLPTHGEHGQISGAIVINNDITLVKEAALKLSESNQRYSMLFEQAMDAFGVTDFNGKVLDVNKSMCRMTGYTKEELLEMHVSGFIEPESLKKQPLKITEIISGKLIYGTRKLRRKDGGIVEVEINAQKISDNSFFTIARDVTQIKEAERKLAMSEATLRAGFEYSAIGMAMLTSEGRYFKVNKELCKITGYTADELLLLNYRQITHPDDLEEGESGVAQLKQGIIDVYRSQKRYLHKDGKIIWANLHLSVVRDQEGNPDFMVAHVEDITAEKEVAALLQEKEELLRLFIEHSPASLAMFDTDMRYIITSRRWITDYGLQGKTLIGKTHYEVFPEISDEWKAIHQRCLAGAIEKNDDDFFQRQDGRIDWVRWEIRPWRKQNGEIGGIIMFTEIITHTKEAELKFRSLTEQSSVGVHIIQDEKYVYVNPKYAEMFGMKPEEMIGKISPFDLILEKDLPIYKKYHHSRLEGESEFVQYEVRGKKRNGEIIWIEAHGSRIQMGGKVALIGSFVDITKRKLAELHLKESEEKNRLVLNTALDCIISVDEHSMITYWNKQASVVFGWDEQEVVGHVLSDTIVPHQYLETHAKGMTTFLATCKEKALNRLVEITAVNRYGKEFPVELTITPVVQAGVMSFTAFIRDISDRKKAETEIRSRIAQLQNISDNLPDTALYQLLRKQNDVNKRFVYISNAVKKFAGVTPEAVLQNPDLLYNCILKEDRLMVAREEEKSENTMTDFNLTVRFRLYTGEIRLIQIRSVPRLLEDGSILWDGILTDITEQQQHLMEIKRLNRLYYFISQANDLLLRSANRDELFAESCRIAVEYGEMRMAWIGNIDEDGRVVPAAWAGYEEGYLKQVEISIKAENPSGRGPTGRAIRSHTYYFCNDIASNPDMRPWRDEALKRGYLSSISYPIILNGNVDAVFTLYVSEVDFFNETEIKLLQEVADNIAFTLDKIRTRELHQTAEEELRNSEEINRAIINAFPDKIFRIQRDGTILDFHSFTQNELYVNPQNIRGRTLHQQLPKAAADILMENIAKAFNSNGLVTLEYILPIKGNDRFHEGRIIAMKNGEVLLVSRDITEQKTARIEIEKRNAEIRERMKELRVLYDISEQSTHGDITEKELFEHVLAILPLGYQYPEITCARIFYNGDEYVSSAFRETHWIQKASIVVENTEKGFVEVFYTEQRPEEDGTVFLNEEKELIQSVARMLSSAIERRIALLNLVESEQKFRSLVEQEFVGVFILQEKSLVYVNTGFEKITGYDYTQLVPFMSFEDLIHPDELDIFEENYRTNLNDQKRNVQHVVKIITSSGDIKYVELIISGFMYQGYPAIIGTATDVTDRIEEERRINIAVIDAQEKERTQIGMELHDNVKQLLAVSTLYIDIAKQFIQDHKDPVNELDKTRALIGEAIFEIRKLSHQLVPLVEKAPDFEGVIRSLIANINQKHEHKFKLKLDKILSQELSKDMQTGIYRILQEQLANIMKHAEAKNIWISLVRKAGTIVLRIKDDGKGFDPSQKRRGIGLENINRRALLMNGKMTVKSKLGAGCELIVSVQQN